MRIRIIGGGPAGLYFGILMKRRDPAHDVVIYERGARDSTWGFGVVFSDRALEFLRADDQAMFDLLMPHMQTWADLTIVHSDVRIPITGNGFASIGRLTLLNLLHTQAEALGVRIEFDSEVKTAADVGPADLVVGSDGAFSAVRQEDEAGFGTSIDWRPNRFIWFGTSKAFDTLSLTFRATPAGVFCAHHYRYSPDMSTFLVEVDAATYERAGFEAMSEAEALRYCEHVFEKDLDGHSLLSNRSVWRQFPAIWNTHWSVGNVVLIGDAMRTAHFSIGSGTRLALEDAVALAKALDEKAEVVPALARFQELRMPPMKKIWDAANVSLRWYERMGEMMDLNPYEFAYRYMTRSGRVNHADLKRRDPKLAAEYERLHPEVR